MISLSVFAISEYKERIPSLYPFTLAQECQTVADEFIQSGSIIIDSFVITNTKLSVSKDISNTAIYFACIELLGHVPSEIKEEDGKKIFNIEEEK